MNVIGPMFRYSMRPTGIENVWSESMNSISDPAATTGCCGLSSKKYRSDAKALGAAWISSRKRMLRSDSGVSDTAPMRFRIVPGSLLANA